MLTNNLKSLGMHFGLCILTSLIYFGLFGDGTENFFAITIITGIIVVLLYVSLGLLLKPQNSKIRNFVSVSAILILFFFIMVLLWIFNISPEIILLLNFSFEPLFLLFKNYIKIETFTFAYAITVLPCVLFWLGLELKSKHLNKAH